jgi:BASS family bile acid:Na+ symporter
MTVDRIINVLVTVTLIEMMIAIGLGVTLAEIIGVVRNRRLLIRAALANYVCVPAAAVGLFLLFRAQPMVAAGFLIAAVCPGAPYGPPFTALAKGNVAVSVGLMVVLAGSSAVLAPLLLGLLLPSMSGGDSLSVDAGKMVVTLLVTQLLPLCVGVAIRQWRSNLAAGLVKPANRLSAILNLSVIGLVLAVQFSSLTAIQPVGFAGMLALVLAALVAGWVLGLPGSGNRRAMAISTSVRNVGVGLVIATSSFPGTPAVTATLAFALFQTVVMAPVAVGWGRLPPLRSRVPSRAATASQPAEKETEA